MKMEKTGMQNNPSTLGRFLVGFVLGGLIGAATALWLAPQSGKKTQALLWRKSKVWQQHADKAFTELNEGLADTTNQAIDQVAHFRQTGEKTLNRQVGKFQKTMAGLKRAIA